MTDERRKEIEKDVRTCDAQLVLTHNDGTVRTALGLSLGHCRELLAEVDRLREAIRQHRDERGDDRCHADDGRLYAVLPEGDTRPERETAVTLENCAKYIECRQVGREYVSPQRRIEELEAEIRQISATLADSHNQLHTMHAANAELRRVASALVERMVEYSTYVQARGSAPFGATAEEAAALAAFAALGDAK